MPASPTTPRGLGRLAMQRSASRASTSPSATRSAPRRRSRATSSSTPGRWRASCRRACSRPNSAGARMRQLDAGRTAARHEPAATRRSICCSPAPARACAPGCPTPGPQYGFLVTHNESISIADYFTVREGGKAVYRPTCHYAYHPANDAVLSLHEMVGRAGRAAESMAHPRRGRDRRRHRRARRAALRPREERLLVRLAALHRGDAQARALPERHRPAGDLGGAGGHGLGAGEPRAPASSRPTRWTSAAASRCSGPISVRSSAHYTDWTPLDGRAALFPEDLDRDDPWQFSNVIVR